MKQASASHRFRPVHLLDLPPGWLDWLILALEQEAGLKALFSTCHKLHDLVFSQAALVPWLRIETIRDLGIPLHVLALAMAEAATANLQMEIQAVCLDPNLLRTRWVDICTRAASLHAQRTGAARRPAVPHQLQCVTRVVLSGWHDADDDNDYEADPPLYLDRLVPDFLVQGCPNLRKLTLDEVTIAASPVGPLPPTCTSLQKLTLQDIAFPDGAPSAAFKQQLLDLPSLTSLSINSDDADDFLEGGMYCAAIDRYSSQLKAMKVANTYDIPWSPGTQLPHLQHLDLPDFSVGSDAVMQQLMQATPSLVSLGLHSIYGLETSFAQEPCSWQELTSGHVVVDQLAKLPLASCTRLVCNNSISLSNEGNPKPTPEQAAAGVAAVQAAGGLQFRDRVDIYLYTDDLKLIPAAAPLLQHLKQRVLVSVCNPTTDERAEFALWSEAQPVLAALGQHLRCRRIWFQQTVEFVQLPQLFPHVEGFECGRIPEAELAEMCRAATRPCTLYLFCSRVFLKQRLEQVQQEAGHQLVTLVLDDEAEDESDDVDDDDFDDDDHEAEDD